MARQKGIIKIKGTLGDITFYKTKDGYMAREKGGVDAKRISSDPAFQRTRENGAEFGRAGKAGKLLRTALRPLFMNSADSRMVGRLTQRMLKVIQTDHVSERGERIVENGNLELLLGFEFNIRGKLSTTLFTSYTSSVNRTTGELKVEFEPFVPLSMITAPSGTTHFKILSGAAEVDFTGETFVLASSESGVLPWNMTSTSALNLVNTISEESELPLFLVLGLEFYQEINGEMYPLKNGAYNPLSLIKVDNVV